MRVILWFFAVIGFLTTVFIILLIVAISRISSRIEAMHLGPEPHTVADNTVLSVDLERPITEVPPHGLDTLFNERVIGFHTLVSAIRRAADDGRVKGLVARTGQVQLGLAEAEEFRDALKAFRAKGKFAFAYADSFGEISGGTRSYFVASGFDQIWLQPAGDLALTGIATEVPFFKGTFDRLGITPEFVRRGEFKTAATEFTDTSLQPTDRAALQDLVGSLYGQLVGGIADGRRVAPDQVRSLVDGGPYSADEALDKHLIDHLGYQDEAEDAAKRQAGPGSQLISAGTYAALTPRGSTASDSSSGTSSSIAVIRAVGLITGGRSDESPFGDDGNVGADTVVRAFDEAVRDRTVRAIVLRINSPGGSEVASETIWRAVKRAEQAGKPVIVSMADEAASGGYYIAAGADRIVAEPMTLTGSIGVFGGKFVLSGLWSKLGVNWDSITQGKNAEFGSSNVQFTPDQQQRFTALIDKAYQAFVGRVAEGRHMRPEDVDQIARGRVWTGAQAKDKGLVDALGGMDEAIRLAKEAAHLPADQVVPMKQYPRRKSPWESLFMGFAGGDGTSRTLQALQRLAALEPVLRELDQLLDRARENATARPLEFKD